MKINISYKSCGEFHSMQIESASMVTALNYFTKWYGDNVEQIFNFEPDFRNDGSTPNKIKKEQIMCSELASMLKKCKSIMDEYDMGDDSEENRKAMEDAQKLLTKFQKT